MTELMTKEWRDRGYERAKENLSAEMKHFILYVAQMDVASQEELIKMQAHAQGMANLIFERGAEPTDYVSTMIGAKRY